MSNRNDPFWAVPVYVVAPPVKRRGSFQNNLDAAIPVFFTVVSEPNSGAIPVRVVVGTGPGPTWPNDRSDAGAIPVYEDPIGVPVWRT
jgi:hypothetical protein